MPAGRVRYGGQTEGLPKKLRPFGGRTTEEDLKTAQFYSLLKSRPLGRMVQKRAPAQRRVTIYRINKALSDGFGIQAEKLGKLLHTFAMRQTDDDSASIRWHPHERDPFHVL
jgi:hypothetical protein